LSKNIRLGVTKKSPSCLIHYNVEPLSGVLLDPTQ